MILRPNAAVRTAAMIDTLEQRRLLTTLPVDGTTGNDTIYVSVYQDSIYVSLNGDVTAYPDASYNGISVSGGDGDDTIYIDATGDNPTTVSTGAGADALYLGHTVHNLDPLNSPVVAVSSDANDSLYLDDAESSYYRNFYFKSDGSITSNDGFFGGVTQTGFASVSVSGGTNADLFYVYDTPATGNFRFLGNAGNDLFSVVNTAGSASVTIDGGAGTEQVDVHNTTNAGSATVYVETTQDWDSLGMKPGGKLVLTGSAGIVFTATSSDLEGDIVLDRGFILEKNTESGNGLFYYRDRLRNGANVSHPTPTLTSSYATSSSIADGIGYGYGENIKPTTIGGYAIETGDLLLRYTISGDANLDGTVNFDDLLILAKNYNGGGDHAWSAGDFDLDGDTDFNDLLALAKSYNQSAPTAATASIISSPIAAASAASATRKRTAIADIVA